MTMKYREYFSRGRGQAHKHYISLVVKIAEFRRIQPDKAVASVRPCSIVA